MAYFEFLVAMRDVPVAFCCRDTEEAGITDSVVGDSWVSAVELMEK
jgi:hypothetical protein